MIGRTVLGYTVEEEIGSGGFGTVYRVSKKNLSGTYIRALKHISIPSKKQYANVLNSMGGDFEKADRYFSSLLQGIIGEIKIISALGESSSKHIVKYYENDIYETQSPKTYDVFILMEYLKPFSDYLCETPVTVKDVIRLGKEILTALKVCHENQIIHRDIKEDNIFVDADGNFKLGDFGVSKMLQDQSRAGSVKGTPNYIAPEVYLGKEKYDLTVDFYSLGIVLYKLLNKSRNPFLPAFPAPYNSDDEEKAFEQRMKYNIPPLPADANNALGNVILKALLPAANRYRSADDFIQALESAENELSDEELNYQINTVLTENAKSFHSFRENPSKQPNNFGAAEESLPQPEGSFGTVDREFFGSFAGVAPERVPVNPEPPQGPPAGSGAYQSFSGGGANPYQSFGGSPAPSANPYQSYAGAPSAPAPGSSSPPLQDPPAPRKEQDIRKWIIYLAPVVIALIYIIVYLIIVPHAYNKTVSLIEWLFTSPGEIVDALKDPNTVLGPIYKIYALKIFNWILSAAFLTSLYFVGRSLHFKKPEVNPNATTVGKTAYLQCLTLLETAKQVKTPEAKPAIAALQRVHDHLKNETDFGIGDASVINCENEIVQLLDSMDGALSALSSPTTAKRAADAIVANCQRIQTKLKIRIELKKK